VKCKHGVEIGTYEEREAAQKRYSFYYERYRMAVGRAQRSKFRRLMQKHFTKVHPCYACYSEV
jgi:hypothetical protein